MTITEATIEVAAPLSTVHRAWRRLEDLGDVLCGIDAIHRIDDTHLHVVGRVGGAAAEWDIHITEDLPDRRVAWTSTGEVRHDGAVTVEPLSARRTRVGLVLDADDMDGAGEEPAAGAGANRAWCDLVEFCSWIERTGAAARPAGRPGPRPHGNAEKPRRTPMADRGTDAPEPVEPESSGDTSIVSVVNRLESEGFVGQFSVRPEGRLECLTCHTVQPASRHRADDVARLEGSSDPADMVVVVPLRCSECGTRGTVLLRYGPEASAEEAEALLAMEREPHEGDDEPD